MSRHPAPYKWLPKNQKKYIGDVNNIWVRSSWEQKAFIFFDTNPSILQWASEEIVIPYISPVDGNMHRYFPDISVVYKTTKGEIKRALVEIKPSAQTIEPKRNKKMSKRYLEEVQTYLVNSAKWQAAKTWCDRNKMEFMLITEHHLFGGKP